MWVLPAFPRLFTSALSSSTKQGLLTLKRTRPARSQKNKSCCVSCNLISNKTSSKTSCTINIFHIYSFSGTVKSIINIKERCRFENTFRIELFVKFKFWLIRKTIIFIIDIINNNSNHKRIMKKIYNYSIDTIISVIFLIVVLPLLVLHYVFKLIRKISDVIVLITKKSLEVLIVRASKLIKILSVKD